MANTGQCRLRVAKTLIETYSIKFYNIKFKTPILMNITMNSIKH